MSFEKAGFGFGGPNALDSDLDKGSGAFFGIPVPFAYLAEVQQVHH